MNRIQVAGQVISSTNYTTKRLFNFNPEPVRDAADSFLRAGVSEIEIPQGVLDPEGRGKETGLDEPTVRRTLELLPKETRVIGSYHGSGAVGKDNAAFLAAARTTMDNLLRFFPDMMYVMLHPPKLPEFNAKIARGIVDTWAELARHAASKRKGFQCCLHNHFDTSCETADQVRAFLDSIAAVNEPALRWGPDTGHCHGMKDDYLKVFDQYAPLIGNYFHIKTRVPAFDQLHGGDLYRADRDIWGNAAEVGRGLYSGFVNCADPEIHTPLKQVFDIIARKARPTAGVVTGAIEIDIPRQHPRLEVLCSVLYLKQVHKIEPAMPLTNDQIVARVFAP
jgi:sugar phosphate isomerase/epimerase